MGEITKAPIGAEDFNNWDGVTSTFNRDTSTGGEITLRKVGYEVDALMVYGGGVTFTSATINSALTTIGTTNKVTLLLRPGSWAIATAQDWSAYKNVTIKCPPGAYFTKSGTGSIAFGGPFEAGPYQVFSGFDAGDVTFGVGVVKEFYPQWYGAKVDDSTDDTTALQLAVSSLPSMSTLFFTGVCKITGELNFSGKKNIILRGNGWADSGGALAGTGGSGIRYAGGSSRSVLWLVGASYITIQDMEISSSATTPPKVVLALGRKDAGSYGWHKFNNIRITGYATHALVYSIASEVNTWDSHKLQLVGGGAKYVFYTSQDDDLSVSAGDFTTSSNLSLFFNNFWVWNLVDDVDAVGIYINGRASTGDLYFRNGSGASEAGSHIQINVVDDADDAAYGQYVFDSIRMENSGTTKYGIKLTKDGAAAAVYRAHLSNLNFYQSDALLYAETGITLEGFEVSNLKATSPCEYLVDIGISQKNRFQGLSSGKFRIRDSANGNFIIYDSGYDISVAWGMNNLIIPNYAATGLHYTGELKLDVRWTGVDTSYLVQFYGQSAANAAKSVTTTQGDGVVTGPQLKSATPGWLFVGMVRINVNGTDYWTPYYSYVP